MSVQLAAKNKMEFALAVTFGSSLQIALFVAPVLVLLGAVMGQPMNLVFTPLEIAAVAAAVGISSLIAIDGETNWLEGALLTLVYAILAISFFEFVAARCLTRRRRRGGGRAAARGRSIGQAALRRWPPPPVLRVVVLVGRARLERGLGDRLRRRLPRQARRPGRRASRPPAAPRSPSLRRPDSISTCEATISVFQCRAPFSSSHERVWSRPSMATCWPLPR